MSVDELMESLKEDVNIDEGNIAAGLVTQPTTYVKYSLPAAEAEYRFKQLKRYVEKTLLSELQIKHRELLSNSGGKKPTISEIEQAAYTDPAYIEAVQELEQAEREYLLLRKAETAMVTKGEMLRSLNSRNKDSFL